MPCVGVFDGGGVGVSLGGDEGGGETIEGEGVCSNLHAQVQLQSYSQIPLNCTTPSFVGGALTTTAEQLGVEGFITQVGEEPTNAHLLPVCILASILFFA